jgi:hypothetical protein
VPMGARGRDTGIAGGGSQRLITLPRSFLGGGRNSVLIIKRVVARQFAHGPAAIMASGLDDTATGCKAKGVHSTVHGALPSFAGRLSSPSSLSGSHSSGRCLSWRRLCHNERASGDPAGNCAAHRESEPRGTRAVPRGWGQPVGGCSGREAHSKRSTFGLWLRAHFRATNLHAACPENGDGRQYIRARLSNRIQLRPPFRVE